MSAVEYLLVVALIKQHIDSARKMILWSAALECLYILQKD
jgi:hypothetical protein